MSAEEDASNVSELRSAVSKIRVSSLRWSDSWLLIAGSVLLPLGIGLILLGWYGSAQTTLDWEQTPYLISGGILGLGLLGVGTAMYFSYWMTRLVRNTEAAAARDRDHQQKIEALLTEIAAGQRAAGRNGARSEELVTTPGGTMLHRIDCVAMRGQEVVRPRSKAGLELCGLCRPTPPTPRKRADAKS
ncbi:MAG TPA: hypothetical protein VHD81_04820 [Mycobacteriales bacterium]|nr:hypothetical protein [Mycobacteriales bacterium]